jgi:Tol biopolymer transport system component/DNA-binding winged helix-turn-helix (wHTH) protein
MSAEMGRLYEFGNFRLDPREKKLSFDGKPVSLTPKVFETLQFFVEHPGHLLAKDELIQELWQDRFVEESNLTFNIKMLRRALNDDAHRPRFIETVPRRGYRFIAEVKEHDAPAAAKTETEESDVHLAELKAPKPRLALSKIGRSYFSIAALSVFVVSAAVIVLWSSRSRRTAATPTAPILSAAFRSEKFSNDKSVPAAITPDGKYVAYTIETGGKQSIWLRQLETSENIQIIPPSDDTYFAFAISHDGNSLYFVRRDQGDETRSAIYRMTTFGGIPVKITDTTESSISLSPDDRQLSFVRCRRQVNDHCSLFVIAADGTNERRLLTRPKPIRIGDQQFSPDGKSIAFASGQSANGGSDFRLMLLDLASGKESEISSKRFFNIISLRWLPDGAGLLFTAKEILDGRLRIWQVATTTGEARALTNDAADYLTISLDQAADKMIATRIGNSFRLHVAGLADFNNSKTLIAARSFAFAPDGKIVYSGDDRHIWTINRDGGEQRQLTNSPFTDFSPQISPDGRYIFFTSNRTGSNQVWRMNADGSNQIQITRAEGGYPRFVSSDGKWIYFESGLHQTLWRASTDGGGEIQVSEGTVYSPAFSPDGKLVAYFLKVKEKDMRLKIAVMSIDSSRVLKIFASPGEKAQPDKIAWASDNRSFRYITENDAGCSLWSQSLDGDSPSLIGDLGNEQIEDFALSPDGTGLAFIRGKWIHDAVLIEGLK